MKAIVCTRYGKTEAVVALADRPVPEVRPATFSSRFMLLRSIRLTTNFIRDR